MSAPVLAIVTLLAIPGIQGLECYSCNTDTTDLDCMDLSGLPTVQCASYTDDAPVRRVCTFQRLTVGTENTEKVFRGCGVAGECALLGSQADGNSHFRMEVCYECEQDNCNDRNGAVLPSPLSIVSLCLTLALAIVLRL